MPTPSLNLYYVEIHSKDESGELVPMSLSALAEDEDAARALIVDSFSELAPEVDFGDLRKAEKVKHGFVITRGKVHPISTAS